MTKQFVSILALALSAGCDRVAPPTVPLESTAVTTVAMTEKSASDTECSPEKRTGFPYIGALNICPPGAEWSAVEMPRCAILPGQFRPIRWATAESTGAATEARHYPLAPGEPPLDPRRTAQEALEHIIKLSQPAQVEPPCSTVTVADGRATFACFVHDELGKNTNFTLTTFMRVPGVPNLVVVETFMERDSGVDPQLVIEAHRSSVDTVNGEATH